MYTEADCLCSPAQVEDALERMAIAITDRLRRANPLVFCVMNGGLVVCGRLLPKLDFPLECAYLHATRYRHALKGGLLDWRARPTQDMVGRSILIVDDILDEGHTLKAIVDYCQSQGAKQVLTAVLVHKQHDRKATTGMRADFTGLEIPDRYVFGCGMDYRGYWRNAAGIYAVKDA